MTREQLSALDKKQLINLILSLQSAICVLQEQIVGLQTQVARLEAENRSLRDQLAKNSGNSGKPPSSDGYAKPAPKSLRPRGERKSGGQPGHKGHTLEKVDNPDHIEVCPVDSCPHCRTDLRGVASGKPDRRQVFDLPPVRITVTEHQAEVKPCPGCGKTIRGTFPDEVTQPTQYGLGVKAWVVYLSQYQLLPLARIGELFFDLFGHRLTDAQILAATEMVAEGVAPALAAIREGLTRVPVAHFDETGMRVEDKLHWLHTAGTESLTYYAVHPKRGKDALREIGILLEFGGRAVHDAYASYFQFETDHALCNAHHLRELKFVEEQYGQSWAKGLSVLLRQAKNEVEASPDHWTTLPPERLAHYHQRYDQWLRCGLDNNPPPESPPRGKRGRVKQSPPKNLLDRLAKYKAETLAFMRDFRVPFDNNLAERDLRMMKVKQKISGTFRTRRGAEVFCAIRSYVSTVRKQGRNVLHAIQQALDGKPFIPATGYG
jgi:transposase